MNDDKPHDLKERTKRFACRIIRLVGALPKTAAGRVIGTQLLRAGTSVGANWRAAARARSRAEFVAKLGIVLEEADEALYWMELLIEAHLVKKERLRLLMQEGNELTAIAVASINTARRRKT
jgi:four helix bundle protein